MARNQFVKIRPNLTFFPFCTVLVSASLPGAGGGRGPTDATTWPPDPTPQDPAAPPIPAPPHSWLRALLSSPWGRLLLLELRLSFGLRLPHCARAGLPAGPWLSPCRCHPAEQVAGLVQALNGLPTLRHSGLSLLHHLHHSCRLMGRAFGTKAQAFSLPPCCLHFYLIFHNVAEFLKQGDSAEVTTAHRMEVGNSDCDSGGGQVARGPCVGREAVTSQSSSGSCWRSGPPHSPEVTFLSPAHRTAPLALALSSRSAREGILNVPPLLPTYLSRTWSPLTSLPKTSKRGQRA